MKRLFVQLLLLFIVISSYAQKPLNGVYAGQHMALLVNGSYMSVEVILFRPDGTFNDDLRRQDWRTYISGKYRIEGKNIQILRNNGKNDEMQFDENGNVQSGGYSLLKMNCSNAIPAGMYRHQSASGSGGSGSAYVGVFHNADIYLDGNGNFGNDKATSAVVSGADVGGGSNTAAKGQGKYTIDNGLLTLEYADGHTEKHSFFCNATEKPVMAVIDGDIYFLDDNNEEKQSTGELAHKQQAPTEAGKSNGILNATSILKEAKQQAGGSHLDAVTTLQITAHSGNLRMVSYMDFTGNRRELVEMRNGERLVSKELLMGAQGWSIVDGKKQPLSAGRITEMKQAFFAGPLALRADNLVEMKNATVRQMNDTLLGQNCSINGVQYVMLFTHAHRMVGEGFSINGKWQTSSYSDFKVIEGIDFPMTELLNLSGQKINIHYDSLKINVPFPTSE